MVRRVVTWLSVAGTLAVVVPLGAQQVGPARGALVLVGGAMQDAAILDRFLTLAGGPEAPIVLVPTAGGAESYNQDWPGAAAFRAAGASRLTVLHTSDRATADHRGLQRADPRGRRRLVRRPAGSGGWPTPTSTPACTPSCAGCSTGAASSAARPPVPPSSARTSCAANTRTNTIMMGDHEEGFGLLRGVGVDQHLLRRNRHFDMVEVIRARPELLGIGIDEDTAIVVRGDTFEVIGSGYVAIYDHARQLDSGAPFYFLSPGDAYDLAGRQAYRTDLSGRLRPLDRVVAAPWSGTAR